jgi:hypothetical protein
MSHPLPHPDHLEISLVLSLPHIRLLNAAVALSKRFLAGKPSFVMTIVVDAVDKLNAGMGCAGDETDGWVCIFSREQVEACVSMLNALVRYIDQGATQGWVPSVMVYRIAFADFMERLRAGIDAQLPGAIQA